MIVNFRFGTAFWGHEQKVANTRHRTGALLSQTFPTKNLKFRCKACRCSADGIGWGQTMGNIHISAHSIWAYRLRTASTENTSNLGKHC